MPVILCCLLLASSGCNNAPEEFAKPGVASERMQIISESRSGPILVVFTAFPLQDSAPPDGVRKAVSESSFYRTSSSAAFFWSERELSGRWLSEQIAARQKNGETPRLIIAGYSLGATEAAETARRLLKRYPDVQIELLITVDAIKTGKISSAVGVTGSVISMANPVPGKNIVFTSYDSAPEPDGRRFKKHVNYYQSNSRIYHGAAMPAAVNQRLTASSQALNHGNSDDYARPFIMADLRQTLGVMP